MQKQALKDKLNENHQLFIEYIHSLSNDQFEQSKNDKWTPGQQLEHIFLSIRPVRLILSAPKFILSLVWGKAKRPSKTYDELINKYKLKLTQGGRASAMFLPKSVSFNKRLALSSSILKEINFLNKSLEKYSEEDLDHYILPHPLLGKITIREMMYFTICHVEHHKILTQNGLD